MGIPRKGYYFARATNFIRNLIIITNQVSLPIVSIKEKKEKRKKQIYRLSLVFLKLVNHLNSPIINKLATTKPYVISAVKDREYSLVLSM